MRKITPEDIKQKMSELELSYGDVYRTLGLSRSWFCKMMMGNKKHSFSHPKEEWMILVMKFLKAHEREITKPHRAFNKKWNNAVKKI